MYPFVRPDEVTQEVLIELSGVFEAFSAFDFRLTRIGWFGEDVLYLAPEPPTPFVEITTAVLDCHPECPPYGGEHTDVVPHLTIGHREHGTLDAAAGAIAEALPIAARAQEIWLLRTRRGVGWERLGRFQLPSGT